ncbi:hypothetical protein EJF18_70223 [Clavispora lusitaniae]|uniref:Uncharacterized protein n=1 Tax=Clavispora lusitaniae TaxID=36911 RepID=A0ACD0WRH0_CLALS|nr:hypothetical protein EJF14_70223 [Clavispora lusitaniae]QFZ35813.1 hypothetical protein EJF16_70223 [Clavispora lusitaniae]QFZ41495.1 hypothetical protein EJF15_70223 [Clavispora lusitaniae]QFZ47173.1 hypothetical protein EJF18_70223 [Clavispora lusitaniae]QFZ52850.1 hypothetical protein EJF17_70223 [Clavispora lusitaniae]
MTCINPMAHLNESFVSNRSQSLWNIALGGDKLSWSWSSWLSLQRDLFTLGLGFLLQGSVGLDSVQELLTTSRVLDVLDSQVDLLLNVSVTNNLVDDDTDSRLGDVENDTGLTLVVLVRHTLLDRTVGLDVDNVSNLVDLQVRRQWNCPVLLEVTLEHVTSTRSVTTPSC